MAKEKKVLPRFYIKDCFSFDLFQMLFDLAKQHSSVNGVNQIAADAKNRLAAFGELQEAIIESNQADLDKLYNEYKARMAKYETMKKCLIGAVLITLVLMIIGNSVSEIPFLGLVVSLARTVFYVVVPVLLVAFIVFRIRLHSATEKYEVFFEAAKIFVGRESEEYDIANARDCKKIDDLYLNSLSPTERELVLLRREQQQQHDEMMRQQKRHQTEVEALQRQIQKDQRELLEYERERQRRYR